MTHLNERQAKRSLMAFEQRYLKELQRMKESEMEDRNDGGRRQWFNKEIDAAEEKIDSLRSDLESMRNGAGR